MLAVRVPRGRVVVELWEKGKKYICMKPHKAPCCQVSRQTVQPLELLFSGKAPVIDPTLYKGTVKIER